MADTDIDTGPSIVSTARAGDSTYDAPAPWRENNPLSQFMPDFPSPETVKKHGEYQAGLLQEKIGNEALIESQRERQDSKYLSEMERKYRQESASTDDLKPWNPQTMAPPPTNLWEKIGSPGFVFAMLASSFSAMPMNSALTAGAAAMNAINVGDLEGYNRAFDEWHANSDLALKRHAQEHAEFEDIAKLYDKRDATWRTKLESLATKYNDKRTLGLLQAGLDKEAMDTYEARPRAMKAYAEAMQANIEQHALINELQKDEDWTKGRDMMGAYTRRVARISEAKRAGLSARSGGAVSPAMQQQVVGDLESALGHSLSPELNAEVTGALGAKGANSARIVSSVAKAIEGIKSDIAAGKSEKEVDPAKRIADAVSAASTTARSASAIFVQKYIQEHPEASSKDIQKAQALYGSMMSGARTLGTRSANIAASINEVEKFGPLAMDAREKVGGTKYTPFNSWKQVVNRATGVKGQGELDVYTAGLLTAYANTLSRTGHTTVESQRRALDLLSTAYDTESFKERVRTMMNEMQVAKQAVKDAESEITESEGEPDTSGFSIVK